MTRKIGPVLATGLVAGNIVGSGVFLLPATLAAVGSISLVGWVIATLGAFATTAVFARLGAISGSPEGLVAYVGEGLGRFAGFATAVTYWMGAWVGAVAIATAVAGYFAVFVPALGSPLPLALTAVGAIWLFTLLNLVGPRAASRFSSLSLVAGIIPLVFIGVAGWAWFDPKVFAGSWNVSGTSGPAAVRTAMISVFWAYTGFESAAVVSAVVKDPRRDVAIATYAGTALAAVIYIAASAVVMGLAPARELAASTAPFALVAGRMLGPGAAFAVAAFALAKTAGTLCGWVLVSAQSARAGANSHLVPGRFAGERPPRRILVGIAVAMSVVALASVSPTLGGQFRSIINVSTVWCVIPYALCCVALWRLAKGGWGERALAAVAFAFNVWLLSTSDRPTVLFSLALAAAIVVLWFAAARGTARAGIEGRGA
ncbi:MAG TPA: amino acid permease [Caulobacteraceae bacterium]|nr:amino acid permease [Caulobacteraceae bacterium]